MSQPKNDVFSNTPHMRLYRALHGDLPQITALVMRDPELFDRLTVRQRGPNDVVCVLKRFADGPHGEVCFGTGSDFLGALLGLEGALSAGRWREDKPWVPEG